MSRASTPSEYTADSFRVLEGLEPVKLRPGMYTYTDNPAHVLQEAIDNSVDEALAGYAKHVTVQLHADGSASVQDDGRGIPVGVPKGQKRPAAELAFSTLHGGAKFNKGEHSAYSFSGGLHGVGVAVTNALSLRLECVVEQNGFRYELAFENGGDLVQPLVKRGKATGQGTLVRFWPDAKYFDDPAIPPTAIEHLLRMKAAALPKTRFRLMVEGKDGKLVFDKVWRYEHGLTDYLAEYLEEATPVTPIYADEAYITESAQFAPGEGAAWALAWVEGAGFGESSVNLIPTISGGTHETGLRYGVTEAVRAYAESHALLPKGVKLSPDDVWKNVGFVLTAKVLDPQFAGQTKEKLTSRDAYTLVGSLAQAKVTHWLMGNTVIAKQIVDLAIANAQARLKQPAAVTKKRGTSLVVLPGKLADCESQDPERTELYIVEGDSAGGSAKQGRDREFQAILASKGKILNTWEIRPEQLFSNSEIRDVCQAIGVDPHEAGKGDLSRRRYRRICILSDADVDGLHIHVLWLSFFYKHLPDLMSQGYIYLAVPPLYRIDVASAGKNRPARKLYVMDEAELEAEQAKLKREGYKSWEIGRFKGLGEMVPTELWDTTLNPDTRRLLLVKPDSADIAIPALTRLMGKSESAARRQWMETEGGNISAEEV